MAKQFEYRTCRNCLGGGCVHCNNRGEIRKRVFTRSDMATARLRQAVFGIQQGVNYAQAAR